MTITAHVCVGAAVGLATQNPTLGFFAGFASHHIIDGIPHSDVGSLGANIQDIFSPQNSRALAFVEGDIILCVLIFALVLIRSNFSPVMFWAMFGAALPDIIDNSPFWSLRLRKILPFSWYHKLHEVVHFTIKSQKCFWAGIMTQIIIVLAALYFLVVVG